MVRMLAFAALMSLCTTVWSAAPASTPDESTTARAPAELRQAVRDTLRLQATTQGAKQQAAARELLALFGEVGDSTTLAAKEKLELRTLLRSRLKRTGTALAAELAKPAGRRGAPLVGKAPQAQADPPAALGVLAQIQPQQAPAGNPAQQNAPQQNAAGGMAPAQVGNAGGGNAFAAETARNAEELIDLIQNTIAPASWEINGGLGTIMYFSLGNLLIVRQTGGIHEQVGEAIDGLKRN